MDQELDVTGIVGKAAVNFDPDSIATSETVLITLVIDTSGSVHSFESELKSCINGYVEEMRKSHHANKILVQVIKFNSTVTIEGFKPIASLDPIEFHPNGSTALYDATIVALDNSLKYQENLVDVGVSAKLIVFIVTDGNDNESKNSPAKAKALVDQLIVNEANMNDFTSILVGVGESNRRNFEKAAREMGISQVKVISDSSKDIRDAIGMLSASTSSAAQNQQFNF